MRLVEFVHHFYDREIQQAKHSRYAIDPDAVEAVMDDEDGTKIRLTSGAVVPVSQTYEEAVAALRAGRGVGWLASLTALLSCALVFFFLIWMSRQVFGLDAGWAGVVAVIGTPVLLAILAACINRKHEDEA